MISPHSADATPAAPGAGEIPASHMNTFQWLLILGFPPNVAAAKAMPELFTTEENAQPGNTSRTAADAN